MFQTYYAVLKFCDLRVQFCYCKVIGKKDDYSSMNNKNANLNVYDTLRRASTFFFIP